MRTHRWPPLALLVVFGLGATGCTAAYGAHYRSASYGHVSTSTTHYDHDRYSNTSEYRSIRRDADRYANFLDHELHLSGRQERNIERLLIDRTRDLLRRTRPRYHHHVYPFPRHNRTRSVNLWWNRTDSYIEHMLNPRQRHEYRHLVRSFEHRGGYSPRDRNRDGGYDWDGDRGRGRGR